MYLLREKEMYEELSNNKNLTTLKLTKEQYQSELIKLFSALSNETVYDIWKKDLDMSYYSNLIQILLEIIMASGKFTEQDIISERLNLTFQKGNYIPFQLITKDNNGKDITTKR